jgi:hypothetical protein
MLLNFVLIFLVLFNQERLPKFRERNRISGHAE